MKFNPCDHCSLRDCCCGAKLENCTALNNYLQGRRNNMATINYEQGRAFALSSISQETLHDPKLWSEWVNGFVAALKQPETPVQPVPVAQPAVQTVTIYTDGSCLGNPGNGGYSAVLSIGKHRREISGGEADTTNNRMELMAVISALEMLKRPVGVVIYTDSTYVKENYPRIERWAKNGWKGSSKQPVLNAELWQRLQKAVTEHCITITFEKVKAHAGHEENERCDKLAREAAMKVVKIA